MKIKIVTEVDVTDSMKELDETIVEYLKASHIRNYRMSLNKEDHKCLAALYRSDARWLKRFRQAIIKGDLKKAATIGRQMDTAPRERIPDKIWNLLP